MKKGEYDKGRAHAADGGRSDNRRAPTSEEGSTGGDRERGNANGGKAWKVNHPSFSHPPRKNLETTHLERKKEKSLHGKMSSTKHHFTQRFKKDWIKDLIGPPRSKKKARGVAGSACCTIGGKGALWKKQGSANVI